MRKCLSSAAAALGFLVASVYSGFGQPALRPDFPSGIRLPAKARGEAAIAALGQRLPEVAAFYGKTPQQLRTLLRQDDSLWADPHGRLFHVCGFHAEEAPVTGQTVDTVGVSPFPPEMAFRLHSRPGANRVVYLDFNGHDASTTSWGADAIARPFDLDGNPATFSTTERERIIYIWQRVAADYAMYDIDVTTEDPGIEALRKLDANDQAYGIRVGIGGGSGDWYGSAGGVAYLRSFDDNIDLPCWVFPKSLGDSEKNIAEATSHEVGHTLGLSHDGRTSPAENYYYGQGNWAPIMGVGYNRPIVQWSKGEYANANQTQDDLTLMLSYGAVYRADDVGDSIPTAAHLTGVKLSGRGLIHTAADVDFFSFATGDGPIAITVNRAPRDSNLRIQLALYNSAGTLLQTATSADTTTGTQPVSLGAMLAAGTYAFSVAGIGNGDPLTTGYTDYASLGEYLITGTLPADANWLPTAGGGDYSWLEPANWSAGVVARGAGAVHRFQSNLAGDQEITLASPLTLGQLVLGDPDDTDAFNLQAAGVSLTLAVQTNSAGITKTSGATDAILVPLILAQATGITNTSANGLLIAGGITGPGALTTRGNAIKLGGGLNHTGGTIVAAGQLSLQSETTLGGAVEVKAGTSLNVTALTGGWTLTPGQSLSGGGTIEGNIWVGSGAQLSPGGGAADTLAFIGDVVLDSGAKLQWDLAATDAMGASNDLITITGDLTVNGSVALNIRRLDAALASPGSYRLINYSGQLSGGASHFAVTDNSTRYVCTIDDSIPGEIRLLVSGAPQPLTWGGNAALNQWDALATTNWWSGSDAAVFAAFDSVAFDDAGLYSSAINLVGDLQPATVTVNTTNEVTWSGDGKLSGAMTMQKSGSGRLTVGAANDFTGAITVTEGTLRAAHAQALGGTNGSTVVTNAGQLDVNGLSLGAEPVFVAGSGPGSGALINSGAAQTRALRFVTLTGDSTLGGSGRWDIRADPTANLSGSFNLTKTGANEIRLVDLGSTQLRDIFLQQGTLGIQDTTTLGLSANNLALASGATLALWNTDNNSLNKRFILNGGTLRNEAGNNIISGPVTVNSNTTCSVTDLLEVQGAISGAGGLTKTGAGTLSLSGINTFTGPLSVAAGTLRVGSTTALGATNGVTTIAADARLDLAGFNLGAETVFVTGDGLGNAGAIVNYGGSQQNALRFITLNGATTVGGISRWDLRANPTGALLGNNQALTKRGPNEIWLVNVGETSLANITAAEGLLGVQGTTTLGNPAATLTVSSGANLGIYGTGTNALAKVATLSNARVYNANGSNVFVGTGSLSGSNAFDIASGTALNWRGALTGSGALWKQSAGTLVLSGNNSYSGITVIGAGTLQIGDGGGSGTTGSGLITNNSVLVLNRTNDFTLANALHGLGGLTKLGAGVATVSGASTFTGGVNLNALNAGVLRLRSNTALGIGPKTVNLKSSGSPNSAGSFGVELENNITLGADLSWNLSNDGLANPPYLPAVRSRSGNNTVAGNLLLQSGGGGTRIVTDAGSTLTLSGKVTTDVAGGRDLILDGAGVGNFTGQITNGTVATMFVNVAKEGAGNWTIAGTNLSSGATLVKAGTLLLSGALGTNYLSVSNAATLRGTGWVNGRALVQGTIAPGTAGAPGTLTMKNALVLAGDANFRLTKSPAPANDAIRGMTSMTYGGTLTVTHSGNALAAGDSFQLFSAASYLGAFSTVNLPPLAAGLVWQNRLGVDGSLAVVAVSSPALTVAVAGGTNLNLQFPTELGARYLLQTTPVLEAPVTWSTLSTNLGTGGTLELPLPVDLAAPRRYFRLLAY